VGGGEPIQRLQAPHGNEEGERLEGDKKKAPLALEGGLSVSGMCALVALIFPTAVDVAAQITWGEWEEMDNAGHWRGLPAGHMRGVGSQIPGRRLCSAQVLGARDISLIFCRSPCLPPTKRRGKWNPS
jgi:hypothetical protein